MVRPVSDPSPRHLVEPSDADELNTSLETPEAAATRATLDALAAEGLLVTSIDAELVEQHGDRAQVVVDVSHTLGRDHPHQSRYDLNLTATSDGWKVTQLQHAGS